MNEEIDMTVGTDGNDSGASLSWAQRIKEGGLISGANLHVTTSPLSTF